MDQNITDGLISRIAEGDEEARNELAKMTIPLSKGIARYMVKRNSRSWLMDEAISVAACAIFDVIRTYDKTKGRYDTYAYRVISNSVNGYLRSERPKGYGRSRFKVMPLITNTMPTQQPDDYFDVADECQQPGWEIEQEDEIKWMLSSLRSKSKDIMIKRYLHASSEFSMKVCAENAGASPLMYKLWHEEAIRHLRSCQYLKRKRPTATTGHDRAKAE